MRRGFTLIEMLVATGIFVIGCVAVFSLFIAAMRFRQQADATIRLSVASTSLLERIRLAAGTEPNRPAPPADYIGDGFASGGAEVTGQAMTEELFPAPDAPTVWYRVLDARDDLGQAPGLATTTTLGLDLFLVHLGQHQTSLTFDDLNRRLRLGDRELLIARLIANGSAVRIRTTIVRRPSWE